MGKGEGRSMAIPTVIDMPTIVFNGYEFSRMVLTPSGVKLWQEGSVGIYSYIYPGLDGQNRMPDPFMTKNSRDEEGRYPLASAATCVEIANLGVLWMTTCPARDTIFKIHPETGIIEFYHGCPRSMNWYVRADDYWKVRHE